MAQIYKTEIIGGKEYRLVELRGRSKLVAKDGEALNPVRRNQSATVHTNPDGYPCFGGGVPVHLYVAHAWVDGWFPGAEVDHINYDRTDFRAENLRWVSHRDNVSHSHDDENHYAGRHAGELNGNSVFARSDVEAIKRLFETGMSTMEVIKFCEPSLTYQDRKKVWNRYNRIKTGECWSGT